MKQIKPNCVLYAKYFTTTGYFPSLQGKKSSAFRFPTDNLSWILRMTWTGSWYPEEFLPALTRHFGPHSLASKNSLYPTLPNPLQTWSQPAGRSQLVNPSKLIQLTLLKAEQGAVTPNCSTSSSEGVVTSSKETAIFLGRGMIMIVTTIAACTMSICPQFICAITFQVVSSILERALIMLRYLCSFPIRQQNQF